MTMSMNAPDRPSGIIVGLGNPGPEYARTRHNVGFLAAEKLVARRHGQPWKKEFGVRWSKIDGLWIIEPQQHMNASGPALQSFLQRKKLAVPPAHDFVVVHDDLDFPLGEFHEQLNRSAAGHNGVQSIIDALGTQNFTRLRIGIGHNRDLNVPAEEYVLQRFTPTERTIIEGVVDQVVDRLEQKKGY